MSRSRFSLASPINRGYIGATMRQRAASKRIVVVAALLVLGAIAYVTTRGLGGDDARRTGGDAPSKSASSGPRPPVAPEQASPASVQPHAPRPLPAADTPLAPIYDDLVTRARSGDAAAASRLFRDLSGCNAARTKVAVEPIVVNHALDEDLSKLSESDLRQRENFLAARASELEKAKHALAVCDGLSETQLQITPIALRAAQLGDTAAANCYVGGFPFIGKGLIAHPEWVTQFRDNALALANAAVASGDWSMVAQFEKAYDYSPPDAIGFLGELTGTDPLQRYRYLRLERLGASERLAPEFDRQIAAAERDLSAEQISAAAAWAQDAYQRSFAMHPERKAMREPVVCPD